MPPACLGPDRARWDQAEGYVLRGCLAGARNPAPASIARRHPEVRSLALLSGGTDRDGRQHLRNSHTLPLLLSAAQDDGSFVEAMGWLDRLSGNPRNEFVAYETGGHGTDMFATREELPGLIVRWFEATLLHRESLLPSTRAARVTIQSAGSELVDLLDEPGGTARAMAFVKELRGRDERAFVRSEAIINQIGYEKIQAGETHEAIEVLRLNIVAFPESPNACDSLSDAYLAEGQTEPARQYSEDALRLLSADTIDSEQRRNAIRQSAEERLRKLAGVAKDER